MDTTSASASNLYFFSGRAGVPSSRCGGGARHQAGISDLVLTEFHSFHGAGVGVDGRVDWEEKEKQVGEGEEGWGGGEVEEGGEEDGEGDGGVEGAGGKVGEKSEGCESGGK